MVPSSSKAIFDSEFPDGDSNQYDWRQSIKYNGSIINLSYKKACTYLSEKRPHMPRITSKLYILI